MEDCCLGKSLQKLWKSIMTSVGKFVIVLHTFYHEVFRDPLSTSHSVGSNILDTLFEHSSDPNTNICSHNVHQTKPRKTFKLVNIELKQNKDFSKLSLTQHPSKVLRVLLNVLCLLIWKDLIVLCRNYDQDFLFTEFLGGGNKKPMIYEKTFSSVILNIKSK